MSSLPVQTREQLASASRKSAAARRRAAERKGMLKRGELSASEFMSDPGNARVRVRHMLGSLPGVGRKGAERLMVELSVPANRRVGGLGPRQRAAIAARFS